MMPSNHLIPCRPLLLPSIFPTIRVFSNESALRIRWPKYWSFSFGISPPNEYPGQISFRMDWLDLLAVQGTLKNHSNKGGKVEAVTGFIFLGSKVIVDGDCSHEIKRRLFPWKESYDQPTQHIKKQRHYFANKGPSSQGYGFSISRVWMWNLDYKESWGLKNWCFWTVMLEKTLESPLDCKEIQPVHSKGHQSWVFFGRNDAEAETPENNYNS